MKVISAKVSRNRFYGTVSQTARFKSESTIDSLGFLKQR